MVSQPKIEMKKRLTVNPTTVRSDGNGQEGVK